MCHVLMINLIMIMKWAVFTLGSITLSGKKIKSNNYQVLCVGRLINIFANFCCDILTGSKYTAPWKLDDSFLFEYTRISYVLNEKGAIWQITPFSKQRERRYLSNGTFCHPILYCCNHIGKCKRYYLSCNTFNSK